MPPTIAPISGMMMSATSELTILPKAVPMMTPTARSTTLPLIANSRNSRKMLIDAGSRVADLEDLELFLAGGRAQRHGVALARLDQRLGDGRDPRHDAARRIHFVQAEDRDFTY